MYLWGAVCTVFFKHNLSLSAPGDGIYRDRGIQQDGSLPTAFPKWIVDCPLVLLVHYLRNIAVCFHLSFRSEEELSHIHGQDLGPVQDLEELPSASLDQTPAI